jgi:hypothetical protein
VLWPLLRWLVLPITVIANIRSNLALVSTLRIENLAMGGFEALLLLPVMVQLSGHSMLEAM